MTESPESIFELATETDRDAIRALFEQALKPFYEGDHVAHADRVLDAHLASDHLDPYGQFSIRQIALVARDAGQVVALVNLVQKKQGTVKLSPVIVKPGARSQDYAPLLFDAAVRVGRKYGAHELYCTISGKNRAALAAAYRYGFCGAGVAIEQYRRDVDEHLLYYDLRPLADVGNDVCVSLFNESDRSPITSLILSEMRPHFNDVDEGWVEALILATRRSGHVHKKGKRLYVAKRSGVVVGLVAGGAKKGAPVKVMPICARDEQSLDTLVRQLPALFGGDGRKLYTHTPPRSRETRIFQKNGWTLEAAFPRGYNYETATLQWGIKL